jgi:NosR/NirI family nitrous oxide reductase transcriptional regulator
LATMQQTKALSKRAKRQRTERIMLVITLILIVGTWILGAARAEADLMPALEQALPTADHFERDSNGIYAAWADSAEENLLGYVVIGTANGYGGPMEMAVAVDPTGVVIGANVVSHKETPSWMDRVMSNGLLEDLIGKPHTDAFQLGEDVDGVTGATYTSRAMAQSVLNGSQAAARLFDLPVVEAEPPQIQFGIPEIVLLALFAVGYFGHQRKFPYKKQARWGSMLVGLVVLGFIYNSPLTLAYFTKMLLGYWPQWQTNLYWYFLIGGIIFVFTVDNKNPYCEWFCPFGAAQECLGAIGGAKVRTPRQYRNWLIWAQRILTLAALLLGIFFRNPGLGSYELFGTLFGFVGTTVQFAALALVLLASLFMRRPWCNYLCPLHAVVELIRVTREWVIELWQKVNPRAKTA